jgi:hypothetical protein
MKDYIVTFYYKKENAFYAKLVKASSLTKAGQIANKNWPSIEIINISLFDWQTVFGSD